MVESMTTVGKVSDVKQTGNVKGQKNLENSVWKGVIQDLLDPTTGMDEEQTTAYLNKIKAKLKSGKNLTQEEMDFLKIHDPQLYMSAMRVKREKENLKRKLENCKSKTEVEAVIGSAIGGISKDDPDKEYLAAGFTETAKEFKKTSSYARLPEVEDDSDAKKKKKSALQIIFHSDEDEEETDTEENVSPIMELMDTLPVFDAKG